MIYYDFIEKFINDLAEKCHIVENAVDRWNAIQMIQNLEGDGFTMVPLMASAASRTLVLRFSLAVVSVVKDASFS